MDSEEQNRAHADLAAGRFNYNGSPDYNEAYRRGKISEAQGDMAGGFLAGGAGLLGVIGIAFAALLKFDAKLSKFGWTTGLRPDGSRTAIGKIALVLAIARIIFAIFFLTWLITR